MLNWGVCKFIFTPTFRIPIIMIYPFGAFRGLKRLFGPSQTNLCYFLGPKHFDLKSATSIPWLHCWAVVAQCIMAKCIMRSTGSSQMISVCRLEISDTR